jgi:molecular chaperone DnaK
VSSPTVVGIDLGTTNSLAAYLKDGVPVVVRDDNGVSLVPSCLSFHPDGTVLVGTAAKERALADPEHTIFSVKRLMGRSLADLKDDLAMIPQQLVEREAEAGRKVLRVVVNDKELTPEELSAMILREVRQRAGNPTKAVITVPAYFDDAQRQATRDAGRIAGLDVLRIVNEPTAAALAYGLDTRKQGLIAVYDLGGGTFDCSLLQLSDSVFKVLSTNGDTHLGGDDFDRELMQHFAKVQQIDLSKANAGVLQQLRDTAERTKIALSNEESVEVFFPTSPLVWEVGEPKASRVGGTTLATPLPPSAPQPTTSPTRGEVKMTRAEFEAMIAPHIDRSFKKCAQALRDAGLKPEQIDEVVLVGGSTRIPYVRKRVQEFFGRVPHTELNPDEVVAIGAAVQADILTGGKRDRLLLDVIPLSLGLETLGGAMDRIIERNTTVPCTGTTRYSTHKDNQTAILVNIYQGEREVVSANKLLGQFKLGGIPPMPAGFPIVLITFRVDANGMLRVTAKEERSGATASVEVKAAHGLNQEEVERLVLESVEFAHEDFAARRQIEFRRKAETDLEHTAKALAQQGQYLSDAQRQAIVTAEAELRAAMQQQDVNVLHRAVDLFGKATLPLAELMMNAAATGLLAGKTEEEM